MSNEITPEQRAEMVEDLRYQAANYEVLRKHYQDFGFDTLASSCTMDMVKSIATADALEAEGGKDVEIERLKAEVRQLNECESDIEKDLHTLNAYLEKAVGRNSYHSAYEIVDALCAERDALAAQVVVLREALEFYVEVLPDLATRDDSWVEEADPHEEDFAEWVLVGVKAKSALALPIFFAAQRVTEWREKSELLDWYEQRMKGNVFEAIKVYADGAITGANPGAKGAFNTLKEALQDAKEAAAIRVLDEIER